MLSVARRPTPVFFLATRRVLPPDARDLWRVLLRVAGLLLLAVLADGRMAASRVYCLPFCRRVCFTNQDFGVKRGMAARLSPAKRTKTDDEIAAQPNKSRTRLPEQSEQVFKKVTAVTPAET